MRLKVCAQIPGESKEGDLPWGQRGGKGNAEPGSRPSAHTRTYQHAHPRSLRQHLRRVQEHREQLQTWASGLRKGEERGKKKELKLHLLSFPNLMWRLGK